MRFLIPFLLILASCATPTHLPDGSLTKAIIGETINEQKHRVRDCYERLLGRHPKRQGELEFVFEINRDGYPRNLKVSKDTLGDPATTRCLSKVMGRMVYPPHQGPKLLEVEYPMVFRTMEKERAPQSQLMGPYE